MRVATMRSPVATRTTPASKRCGCRYQKRESCRHDWVDEASRARREKIEDKGSGRSSGKHAHVVTCTSPLQRTSEQNTIRQPPRTRAWVARQSTCDAHRQRCTTPASIETIRSTPLHMSIVDRTRPSTAGMVDGHHGSWTRHQGRNLDGTRVVVRQQRRLTALDMSPCGLPGSSHVVNALRCESVVVDACARQRRRFMVLRRCRDTCDRPQDRFFAHRSPCGEMWVKPVRPVRDP